MAENTPSPEALRALAHPLWIQLLMEFLESSRPMRATDLGERSGIADNILSYHLRRLLSAGLIERSSPPPGSTKRDKWYSARREDFDFRAVKPGENPELDAAIVGIERQRYAWLAEQAIAAQLNDGSPMFHLQQRFWLTDEQARAVQDQMDNLVSTLLQGAESEGHSDSARRYTVALDLIPETSGILGSKTALDRS